MAKQLLMIPGPVEMDGEVLAALARPAVGHTSAGFLETFGACLDDLREVFAAPDGQPFVVAGSGTLAMEMAVSNLVEAGDRVLVVDTGHFSVRMVDILQRYGAQVNTVSGGLGDVPTLDQVEEQLKQGVKFLFITHVDTSTGVLAPVKELGALAKQYHALTVVDGVCAVAGQEFRMADWGVDVCLTGSQKALAVPPGLAIVMARPAALDAFRSRKTPGRSYYCDWALWLPVMQAYQARKAAYFATPPVNLVTALAVSLKQIKAEGMQARWLRHCKVSDSFKAGAAALGLRQVPVREDVRAVTLTTLYYPNDVDSSILARIAKAGVVVAGGLFATIAARSFRIGHMGVDGIPEILATLAAIEAGLGEKSAVGVTAAQAFWMKQA